MGIWSVSKIKRVEFTTVDSEKLKGYKCESCELALKELRPIVDSLGIPLEIIKRNPLKSDGEFTYPRTCVVKEEDNGNETTHCIIGWDETYTADLLVFLERKLPKK